MKDYQKAFPLALRPSLIRTMNSKNILIEGLHIRGSSMLDDSHSLFGASYDSGRHDRDFPWSQHGRNRYRFQPRCVDLRLLPSTPAMTPSA